MNTKTVVIVLRVVFWIALASLPVVTDSVVTEFMVTKCAPDSECLTQAMPLIVNIGIITLIERIVLWPVCLWFVGGRWFFYKLRSKKKAS